MFNINYRQTDRQTADKGQTERYYRQTDRQIDRQSYSQTDLQTDRQTDML